MRKTVKIKAVVLICLLCTYLALWSMPCDYIPEPDQIEGAATGTYLVIAPDKRLIGWGSNETKLLGNGVLPYYPYIARKTILKNIEVVRSNEWNCAMAVDGDGILWGWGQNTTLTHFDENGPVLSQYASKPVKIMEHIVDVDVGEGHAIVLKEDGTVWTWGDARGGSLGTEIPKSPDWFMTPQKILDSGVSVFAFHKLCFAIDSNHDLFVWGNQTGKAADDMRFLCYPQKIASNIKDVSMQNWKQYLLLSTNGDVLLLDISKAEQTAKYSADMISGPVAENIAAIYKSTLKKSDGTYWRFDSTIQNNGQIHMSDKIVVQNFEIGENGQITASGLWPFKSFRLLSPLYRNVIFTSAVVVFFLKITLLLYEKRE